MIQPTDHRTHQTLLRYHATPEPELPTPQISAAQVSRELREDEWTDLVTGNGDYVPHTRQGKSRPPVDGPEDNR